MVSHVAIVAFDIGLIVPACSDRAHYGGGGMERLCERPGCSDRAAVTYGMRTEDLVFWLDVLSDSTSPESGVLCRRHGDSMVVPRGWTLDDHRDPDLHLFRPPTPAATSVVRRRRRPAVDDESRQLELGGLALDDTDDADAASDSPIAPVETVDDVSDETAGDVEDAAAVVIEMAWTPNFDDGDDLDGLLSARSPLLSRAFRGGDRRN